MDTTKEATINESMVRVFSPENDDIEILDSGRSITDVIDRKVKELGSQHNSSCRLAAHHIPGVVNTPEIFDIFEIKCFFFQGKDEPFHVLNLDDILEKHNRWITRLPRVKPFYAVKCNNTPAVIRMLIALDTGFDCASKAEIELALSLGVTPDKIIYAHPTKPRSHIRYARTHRVNVMTFDNEEELLKISLTHPQAKLVMRIAVDDSKSLLRLNAKFGVRLSSVSKLLECARRLNLEVIGVSFHVGSGCTGSLAFKQAITDARYAFDIANSAGFQMRLLDIGGGFPGTENFIEVKFEEFSEVINKALDELFPPANGLEIIAEPGRFYVDSAFTLAVNVISKRVEDTDERSGKYRKDYSSEKMMMYYISDGVYGSLNCLINDPFHDKVEPWPLRDFIFHLLSFLQAVDNSEPRYYSVIWGPTCAGSDKVTESCWIPELHVGDWLLIDNMGAYSLSTSTDFNGFERAHIYPVVTAKTWLAIHQSCLKNTIN
ncbi:ornithine decarboxylase-like [Simochromis diagramma]|uniref:ornithine decarboxylase-like n=1 Tax=Simochromis diagramma TaxID=43689 RepID=UPI001A7EFC56|nr:ornithine decarboxylase-like [Simochromis diagramma]